MKWLLDVRLKRVRRLAFTRREFLKGMGVTVGGFGMTKLGYDKLIPFIHQPDDIIPGVSTWYATSCRECPAGCGMVVRSREAHVVKCEGNPKHPINIGTLCSRGQAALQGLYDPDRVKNPLRRSDAGDFENTSWDDALKAVGDILKTRPRIAVISDLQAGSLDALMRQWISKLGSNRLVTYEPINYESVKTAVGGVVPSFDIAGSDFLISFAADFLETWISPIEYAVGFGRMRQLRDGNRSRFVYVGPRVSMTAANADTRIIVPPGAEADVAKVMANVGLADAVGRRYKLNVDNLISVANQFQSAAAPLALPGGDMETAQAVMALNGGPGSKLVNRSRPHAVTSISPASAMTDLISSMEAGEINALIIFGANPVYGLAESARFIEAITRVPNVISLSSFMDETSTHAHWVLPSNTPLESWGDYAPYPDTRNLMQPTIGTMFDTMHTGDILIELAKRAGIDSKTAFRASNYYEYLRTRWGAPIGPNSAREDSAPAWEGNLQVGGSWPGAAKGLATPVTGYETGPQAGYPVVAVAPAQTPASAAQKISPAVAGKGRNTEQEQQTPRGNELWLWAYPQMYLYDGRGANKPWLQEMPEPVTYGAWGTFAEVHPSTAKRLNIEHNEIVEISYGGHSIKVPAYVWNGIDPDTIAVPLGEGHSAFGRYASGLGANVLKISNAMPVPVRVSGTGSMGWAAQIKSVPHQYGRAIARTTALGKEFTREEKIKLPLPEGYTLHDFYPGHKHAGYRWAMVVDMDRCIGCNACVTACYAENNIGIVGIDGIKRRREMSWIRIDRYFDWEKKPAEMIFQPMLCQHCDSAPCEPVCPVYAAYHSEDGINAQIYNRCVGTRYCSNNCPYKVRRFNWYDYKWPTPLNYQLNPDVTVRSRGVMEKCTFCIQRVREAGIVAKREGRRIAEGEITPACMQTCPTNVFSFGDLKDPSSKVSKIIQTDPRAYQVLGHLNTKTAVIYLKKILAD